MSGGDVPDRSLAMGDGVVASELRPVMKLLVVRGSAFTAAAAAAAAADPVMDAEVWKKMPEEVMWEVLRFVPATKLFQLQVVSPKWRRVLTSARFQKKFIECHGEQQQQQQALVAVACRPGIDFSSGSDVVLEVDLSKFVPSWFWARSDSFRVVAAAHGLVCIRNDADTVTAKRYCVLNPLTRTSIVLPEPPVSPNSWVLPSSTSVAIWFQSDTAWHSATFDLAAAGAGWVAAVKLDVPRGGRWWPQPVGALLGGQTYNWYMFGDNRVVVMAADGVEVGAVDLPSVTLLGLDEEYVSFTSRTDDLCVLIEHRGALYLVAELEMLKPGRVNVLCGLWQLARQDEQMEWHPVALLERPVMERLTGVRRGSHRNFHLVQVCGVREFVCCHLMEMTCCHHMESDDEHDTDDDSDEQDTDQETTDLEHLVGFNLDTGTWELLYSEQESSTAPMAFELRPDLFLSSD